MPLIQFPNVPNALGVPPLQRLPGWLPAVPITPASLADVQTKALGTITGAQSSASALASLSDLSSNSASAGPELTPGFAGNAGLDSPGWSILDVDGNAVVKPDSVISFEVSGESKISTYPVEEGSFASYNKVRTPNRISMRLACTGNGQMTRSDFLLAFDLMKDAIDLYTINTPDMAYQSMNLVHFDYSRQATNGAKLIVVDAHFEEVLTGATATGSSPAMPSGCDPISNGNVNPLAMTAPGTSALTGGIPSLPSGIVSVVGQQALAAQKCSPVALLSTQLTAGVT